jgi:hypothetical protein
MTGLLYRLKNAFRSHEQLDITVFVPVHLVGVVYDDYGCKCYCGLTKAGYNWFVNEYLPPREQKTGIEIDRNSIVVDNYKIGFDSPNINLDEGIAITIRTMAFYPD